MTQTEDKPRLQQGGRRKAKWIGIVICAVLLIGAAIPAALVLNSPQSANPQQPIPYLGLYDRSAPLSYSGASAFAATTGVRPNMLMYYSAWREPFQANFAIAAAKRGAVPLVQMNPSGINLAAIASGQYDSYLSAYANAVRAYHNPVILSFGHEMNGYWYSWSHTQTSPQTFVAAWRHIVTLFRIQGVHNVTWLWTINIVQPTGGIAYPGPWWPGNSYVNWVGIDGYYSKSSSTFSSLFGATIAAVREMTSAPILIAETAASSAVGQPAKIADLFAGIRIYGLLGFVWFSVANWRIDGPAAITAFRQGANASQRAAS